MLRRHPVLMWAIPIVLGALWFCAATAEEESVAGGHAAAQPRQR